MKWWVAVQTLSLPLCTTAFQLGQPYQGEAGFLSTRLRATALPMNEAFANAVSEESKVGVLLLNLGGPETGEDVEG